MLQQTLANMGPEGVWISEMFGLEKYTFLIGNALYSIYIEHIEIYMNIIKSKVRISEVRFYCMP